jgi:uncharacterized protein (TIGR01777 family)
MKICIAGGSGFIGRNLSEYLIKSGHEVILISHFQIGQSETVLKIRGCEVLVNLMGESIAGRWTKKKRRRIMESRIDATRNLLETVRRSGAGIRLIVGVSAVGIYDSYHEHKEDSKFYAGGFLQEVVLGWEAAYAEAGITTARLCLLRLGVVLAENGGMFQKISRLVPNFAGIVIKGKGNFPFIHVHDLVRCFEFIVLNEKVSGIVNVTAPVAISIKDFYKMWATLKGAVVRFYLFDWMLRLGLGTSAVLLTDGQHVVPEKLMKAGFRFAYPTAADTLNELIRKQP